MGLNFDRCSAVYVFWYMFWGIGGGVAIEFRADWPSLLAGWSSPENTNGYVGAGMLNSSIFSGKGISRATSAPALRLELQSDPSPP